MTRAASTIDRPFAPPPAKGVCFHKKRQRFVARIMVDGRRITLGEFRSLDEAKNAYQAAAIRFYGDFRRGAP